MTNEELWEALAAATHCWLAYAPCGCLVASIYDLEAPEGAAAATRAAVAELVRDGRRLVRVERAAAPPPRDVGCACPPPLFGPIPAQRRGAGAALA